MTDFFTSLKQQVYTSYVKAVDKHKETLTESRFVTEGVLTPDEFLAAGNELVFKCKTWEWAAGDASRRKEYLPADKQYLVTKNVRCAQRCADLMGSLASAASEAGPSATQKLAGADDLDDDEWVTTAASGAQETPVEEMAAAPVAKEPAETPFSVPFVGGGAATADEDSDSDGEVADFDLGEDLAEEDPAAAGPKKEDEKQTETGKSNDGEHKSVVSTRTYDLYITYDHYYRTPRVWLSGFDEDMKPLTPDQLFEDISADHAHKTVTFDEFPYLPGVRMAYIHPCKHAAVMKKIVQRQMEESDDAISVEQYLILFIKFISSVIPTIEYDFTMEVQA